MDLPSSPRSNTTLQRQLANLKLVSRLLGHELHSQSSAKTITLSRESVQEIQTTLDLFIEEVSRSGAMTSPTGAAPQTIQAVSRS